MENLATLIEKMKTYTNEDLELVYKAFDYANRLHSGQTRESGEPYISHPLAVAHILAGMYADVDTVCAALLHDTIEDTDITKKKIAEDFNEEIAELVDGVTRISRMHFSSKEEQNLANTRKIIASIIKDLRIIIIKLADRLHNMRTLQYKRLEKQKENAKETMDIFVPLAYYVGAYRIKEELEDLSFMYLNPQEYTDIKNRLNLFEKEVSHDIEKMLIEIDRLLNTENIPHEIVKRVKNLYGIYKKSTSKKFGEMEDLFALRILTEETLQCYIALGLIHKKYRSIGYEFRDYIGNPKTNFYSSLHTSIYDENNTFVQARIRTFKDDLVASHGLPAYWYLNGIGSREDVQRDAEKNFSFITSVGEIDEVSTSNSDFLDRVKSEIFTDSIFVYGEDGGIIELPNGSTPIDLAYRLSDYKGDKMVGVIVNCGYVTFDYKLKDKDKVTIITDQFSDGPKEEWVNLAYTTHAKQRILRMRRKNENRT